MKELAGYRRLSWLVGICGTLFGLLYLFSGVFAPAERQAHYFAQAIPYTVIFVVNSVAAAASIRLLIKIYSLLAAKSGSEAG